MKKYLSFSLVILIFLAMACSKNNSTGPIDNTKTFSFDSLTTELDSIKVNGATKITAHATGSGLTYTWVASEGTILGNGSQVTFTICHSTLITVKCTVADDNSHSATKEVKVASCP
jgi:hypothetical protein